jgi:hypothetical protein
LWRGCCRHAGFNEADPRQILEDNQANLKGRRVEWELASFLAKYPPEIASPQQNGEALPTAVEIVYDNYNALAIGFEGVAPLPDMSY